MRIRNEPDVEPIVAIDTDELALHFLPVTSAFLGPFRYQNQVTGDTNAVLDGDHPQSSGKTFRESPGKKWHWPNAPANWLHACWSTARLPTISLPVGKKVGNLGSGCSARGRAILSNVEKNRGPPTAEEGHRMSARDWAAKSDRK